MFASKDSERGSHRVQWISGGGCVVVISFLTCHLLFQLLELDLLPFETRSDIFPLTGKKTKNQLKISEKQVLRGLRKSELIFDMSFHISTF